MRKRKLNHGVSCTSRVSGVYYNFLALADRREVRSEFGVFKKEGSKLSKLDFLPIRTVVLQ